MRNVENRPLGGMLSVAFFSPNIYIYSIHEAVLATQRGSRETLHIPLSTAFDHSETVGTTASACRNVERPASYHVTGARRDPV